MLEKEEKKINLSDLIDIKFLQELQDVFAKTVNIASIMVDDNGPITEPSNFTDFCIKYTRGSQLGYKRCNDCDIRCGKIAAETGKPAIYNCHSGLTDFAVPIVVDGQHIASILSGQVLTEPPDEKHFRKIAKELEIDEDEYIEALRKIKIVPIETINAAANLLYFVANTISEISLKNLELIKKNKREELAGQIVEKIRSTLDPEEIKKYFVEITRDYFDADRCLFVDYDKATKMFIPFRLEKLKSPDIPSLVGVDLEKAFPEFCAKLKKGKNIIIKDLKKTLSRKSLLGYKAVNTLKKSEVKSDYGLVVKCRDEVVGILIIHFTKEKRVLTHDEFAFLKTLREHAGTALGQAELYEIMKQQAKNENLIRNITEKIRSSLDIDEALTFICEEVAKLFNVQRATIVQFPIAQNYEEYLIKSEYKINSEIKGLPISEYVTKTASYLGTSLLKEGKILALDNIQISDTPDYFKECYKSLGVKSMIGSPIKKEDNRWGFLVLSEYNYYRHWTEEDKKLLETISDQIYIAIHQAELYNALKQNTSNLNAIMNNMPFIAWLKDNQGRFLAVNNEFARMCDIEVENLLGKTDFDIWPKELAQSYFDQDLLVMKNREMIPTVELIVGPDGGKWHETFKSPVFDGKGNVVGTVGMSRDVTERKEAELELLNRQEQIVKANKRESLLRKIMLASVSTFDIKEVINTIVTETGKVFKADRCFFVEYDIVDDLNHPIKDYGEYLSSDDIKSRTTRLPGKVEAETFVKLVKQRKIVTVENAEEADLVKEVKQMLVNDLSVKSYLVAPVYYRDVPYGALVLQYVKEFTKFTPGEIDFAQAIASQSAIVIRQAQLYSTIEKNEKYTRTILDSIKDGIIIISNDFIVESCNPAAEIIWNYSSSEMIGQKLDLFLYYECKDGESKTCLSKKTSYGIKKGGEKFPVEIDVSEINFEDKQATLLVIRDITERKKIDKMKNEFVSTVSHELRTPLTSIKGSLGLVTSGVFGQLPDKLTELVTIANNNCSRLTNLINDILDLEKIKAGKYEFMYEELEINSIIKQSVVLNQSYADQFGMSLKIVGFEDEIFIKADKNRLLQVISNLISNAVKFSKPKGEVTIASEIEYGNIKILFKDKGIGIPEDSKYKIFQSFSQVDSSDTRSKGGTGLGLSICKLIIESMGGEIGFDSLVDKGSTFFFIMPTIEKGSFVKTDGKELKDLNADEDSW